MNSAFDEDYYLRGKQTGKSLYENYRWLPDLTIPMVWSMMKYLGIGYDDLILDFGCARGYMVRALRDMGHKARGYDTSEWAVKNCDPSVKAFVSNELHPEAPVDWIIAKDVLEHAYPLQTTINQLVSMARIGIFVVVPLGYGESGYVVPEYDNDVTHLHRFTLPTWAGFFMRPGWSVTTCYRVQGIKDNYAHYPMGNGFITARRIPQ